MRSLRSIALGALAAVVVFLVASLLDPWDLLPNPFERSEVDRSAPALLEKLEDLSEYHAASAQLQELIDIEEDVRFVPSFIAGERVSFLAFGTVDAIVDFSALEEGAIEVSEDRTTVHVRLPPARIGEVNVDPERSRVLDRDRGVLDRLGGVLSDNPTGERELYLEAQQKLRRAAADSELTDRAEANTRRMLRALFETLGFEDVTIEFATPTGT
jgi:hypothetical protein